MEKKKRKGKRKRTSSLSSLTQQTAQSPFKKLKVYTLKLLHLNPANVAPKISCTVSLPPVYIGRAHQGVQEMLSSKLLK